MFLADRVLVVSLAAKAEGGRDRRRFAAAHTVATPELPAFVNFTREDSLHLISAYAIE